MSTADDEARAIGFLNAADRQHYEAVMREEMETQRWIEAGAPSMLEMWRQLDGAEPFDTIPLTVDQAARRLNVKPKTIRRRLPQLTAMDPPGAWRVGKGDRAPWRIVPAALDKLKEPEAVEPESAKLPRGNRKPKAQAKRSATRWEV